MLLSSRILVAPQTSFTGIGFNLKSSLDTPKGFRYTQQKPSFFFLTSSSLYLTAVKVPSRFQNQFAVSLRKSRILLGSPNQLFRAKHLFKIIPLYREHNVMLLSQSAQKVLPALCINHTVLLSPLQNMKQDEGRNPHTGVQPTEQSTIYFQVLIHKITLQVTFQDTFSCKNLSQNCYM